jgi:hypothetical protein
VTCAPYAGDASVAEALRVTGLESVEESGDRG